MAQSNMNMHQYGNDFLLKYQFTSLLKNCISVFVNKYTYYSNAE